MIPMSVTTFSHIHRAQVLGGHRYHHLSGTPSTVTQEPMHGKPSRSIFWYFLGGMDQGNACIILLDSEGISRSSGRSC
jgi:hypothetical protein